ncbi:MAG TPA: zeta toxin family protein [Pyrinomonadaceae bacterium]|jgi:predicted ABC-type ATPase|nr:zeta toxin family protein [Pyrinomonadaceae bacterium]
MSEGNLHVVIIAGPNGAGKSTLAPFLLRDTFGVLEYVNADPIAIGLSAFDSASMSVEAGRIVVARLRDLAKRRKSFAFETTLASRFYASWLKRLRESGYKSHLVFLWLSSLELAIERVEERVRIGGHSIPEEVIRRRYDRGLTNLFDLYRPLADTWAVYDNSGSGTPLLVSAGGENISQRVIRPDTWSILLNWQNED